MYALSPLPLLLSTPNSRTVPGEALFEDPGVAPAALAFAPIIFSSGDDALIAGAVPIGEAELFGATGGSFDISAFEGLAAIDGKFQSGVSLAPCGNAKLDAIFTEDGKSPPGMPWYSCSYRQGWRRDRYSVQISELPKSLFLY